MPLLLFTQEDLEAYLQRRPAAAPGDSDDAETDPSSGVDQDTFLVIERVVNGWLLDACGFAEWPWSKTPPPLFSWALELAAIAHENPASAATDTVDKNISVWNESRRNRILDRAAEWARDTPAASSVSPPRGSFPRATGVDLVDQPFRLYPGYNTMYPRNR